MLSRFFLGSQSNISFIIPTTPDKIKLYLSLKFQNCRPDQFGWLMKDQVENNSKIIYSTKANRLTIYDGKYPSLRFKGNLFESGNSTKVSGVIGENEWNWWFRIIWIGLFAGAYLNWRMGGESYRGAAFTIYPAMIGLAFLIFKIILLRRKTNLLREELESIAENFNSVNY